MWQLMRAMPTNRETQREQFREPWRTTAIRTGSLALAVGVGAGVFTGRLAVAPLATLMALWLTLGGHFVELLYRNTLRHYFAGPPIVRVLARLCYWFAAGSALYEGALVTRAGLTTQGAVSLPWWTGGVVFTAIEFAIHLFMRARQQPNLFDGRA
jgi:hypothetical protein